MNTTSAARKVTAHQFTALRSIATDGRFNGRNRLNTLRALELAGLIVKAAPRDGLVRYALTDAGQATLTTAAAK